MAMAESTFTAFLQSHSHQQLPFLQSSELPLFHVGARSDPQWLRFLSRPLSLHIPHPSRLKRPIFPSSKICCNVSDARGSGTGNNLDLEQGDAVSWVNASIQESVRAEKQNLGCPPLKNSSASVFGSEEGHGQGQDATLSPPASAGGVMDSVRMSRRGRTKKTLRLTQNDMEQPSGIDHSISIGETALKSRFLLSEKRDTEAGSPSPEAKRSHRTGTNASISDRVEEWKSMISENKHFRKSVEREKKDESKEESQNEIRARLQDLINADLETKFNDESDDEDCPLWVDEDDPNWLEEPDDGWGFRVSEFFTDKAKIVKNRDGDDNGDADSLDWDLEPEKWSAKEIDFMDWTATVFGDPSPLVVLLFERYGKKARENYHVLRELEAAANRIWESHRLPPRLVKINASVEVDLASALKAKEFPMLLFIRAGKLLHRQTGYYTADDLMRMIAYFYHGAGRPSCLKKVEVPESVPSN